MMQLLTFYFATGDSKLFNRQTSVLDGVVRHANESTASVASFHHAGGIHSFLQLWVI